MLKNRFTKWVFTLGACLAVGLTASAQDKGLENPDYRCEGLEATNGTTITISQMRPGFSYTATAIGLDGFDPLLMTVDANGRVTECNDNNEDANEYSVEIPALDLEASGNRRTAQVEFDQPLGGLNDMRIVVSGVDGETGTVLVLIEGMAVTDFDGFGDPILVDITQSLLDADEPVLQTFIVGTEDSLDPSIFLLGGSDGDIAFLQDRDENYFYCDDAGDSRSCFGNSETLDRARIETQDAYRADEFDAMIEIELDLISELEYEQIGFLFNSMGAVFEDANVSYGKYTSMYLINIG
jgi:hypothetical protein